MGAPARQIVSSARRAMLAKVHLAAKEIGLADDDRRDVLQRLTGHRSSADCTDVQLEKVIAHFKAQGWKPKAASGAARSPAADRSTDFQRRASSPMAGKARAMWISLFQLGVVRSSTERSLEAFAQRQLGVDRLQWADQGQGFRLIEALKAMAERNGWSQDVSQVPPAKQIRALKMRLVNRQAEILGLPAHPLYKLDDAALDRLVKDQGVEIRALQGATE